MWDGLPPDPDYFTPAEYTGGYDEVTITKPSGTGTVSWEATLYYQTTSKEYIEFLRDEINGVATTLYWPTYYQDNYDPSATDPAYLVLRGAILQ